jgi:hypothetical protein
MCRQEKMVCLKWISEMVEDMRVEQKAFEGIFIHWESCETNLIKTRALDVFMQQQGGGQGGWLGTVSSLASQFLQTKLDDQSPEDATNYVAPAEQAGIPGPKTRVASDVSILVSGCQTDETSADANPTHSPANSYGAFSNAIQTVLTQNPSPMTNRDLVLAVRKVLAQQGFKQHPCLYCSDGKVDAPFICE